mmetsp:Transcript_56228/g.154534  ORF Transcript_56228/g.154534 Transcript_56228/m.154534 type:complete len:164 (-) Transcript_56228:390-881(-)
MGGAMGGASCSHSHHVTPSPLPERTLAPPSLPPSSSSLALPTHSHSHLRALESQPRPLDAQPQPPAPGPLCAPSPLSFAPHGGSILTGTAPTEARMEAQRAEPPRPEHRSSLTSELPHRPDHRPECLLRPEPLRVLPTLANNGGAPPGGAQQQLPPVVSRLKL